MVLGELTMEKNKKALTVVKEYALMTVATLTMACGIYFFKFPNDFVMGGVSGISMFPMVPIMNLSISLSVTLKFSI